MQNSPRWNEYLNQFPPRNPAFVQNLYAVGSLPPQVAEDLRKAIVEAPSSLISDESFVEGSAISLVGAGADILNAQHTYRFLDEPTKAALAKAFDCLKETVSELLNSPWRILNVRSWTTKAGADYGPNAWHKDGDIKDLLKMMIYSSEEGGIELRDVSGEEVVHRGLGTWVLFYNSVLSHRGRAPSGSGLRVATEITIAPSFTFDLEPRSCGLIARHSALP